MNNPVCSNHIATFFEYLLKLYQANVGDPFSGYLIALFDGLSTNDAWIQLDRLTYKQILKQINSLKDREFKDYSDIDKEIIRLEGFGVNTTPFPFE